MFILLTVAVVRITSYNVCYTKLLRNHDIKTLEYTPLQVKKAITWNWQAKKAQLQNAIKMLFRLEEIPRPDDAADAIVITSYSIHYTKLYESKFLKKLIV